MSIAAKLIELHAFYQQQTGRRAAELRMADGAYDKLTAELGEKVGQFDGVPIVVTPNYELKP